MCMRKWKETSDWGFIQGENGRERGTNCVGLCRVWVLLCVKPEAVERLLVGNWNNSIWLLWKSFKMAGVELIRHRMSERIKRLLQLLWRLIWLSWVMPLKGNSEKRQETKKILQMGCYSRGKSKWRKA